jgi:endonuclease YncB( thermonuclease family)
MFHKLHKLVVVMFWVVLAALGIRIYQQRAVFSPLVDLIDSMLIREGFEQKISGEITGRVVKVIDGDTFQIRDDEGRVLKIRLTGLDAPDIQQTNKAELLLAGESKTNLTRLILSKPVRVQITYSNDTSGALGIAYLGETNVNATMVALGMARLKREYMNGLPLKSRYALLRADRRAKDQKTAPESPK